MLLVAVLALPSVNADEPTRIPQAWSSSGTTYAETDSVAAARMSDGSVRVFATSKKGDRVDVFDAATGKHVQSIGRPGKGGGELHRPNGIVALDWKDGAGKPSPLIFVTERDNGRLQAFWAESGKPAGIVGQDVLSSPYGLALSRRDNTIRVYVTEYSAKKPISPEKTVKVFDLSITGDIVSGKLLREFGERTGKGLIGKAETILVDDEAGRVLLCDEAGIDNVKIYTLDGKFTGQTFADGLIATDADAEGLASLGDAAQGVYILTEQRKNLSIWHLFDRKTLKHLAAFTGAEPIANTDGICVFPGELSGFKDGLFVAVDNDADVRAYSLTPILELARKGAAQ